MIIQEIRKHLKNNTVLTQIETDENLFNRFNLMCNRVKTTFHDHTGEQFSIINYILFSVTSESQYIQKWILKKSLVTWDTTLNILVGYFVFNHMQNKIWESATANEILNFICGEYGYTRTEVETVLNSLVIIANDSQFGQFFLSPASVTDNQVSQTSDWMKIAGAVVAFKLFS
ncbi:MAG: hypothetical protein JW917_00875 [Ignavibacteria bacterium]|nr:hypothetical protein [Ignavibacteria bacterium]